MNNSQTQRSQGVNLISNTSDNNAATDKVVKILSIFRGYLSHVIDDFISGNFERLRDHEVLRAIDSLSLQLVDTTRTSSTLLKEARDIATLIQHIITSMKIGASENLKFVTANEDMKTAEKKTEELKDVLSDEIKLNAYLLQQSSSMSFLPPTQITSIAPRLKPEYEIYLYLYVRLKIYN